ncbi:MAG: thermonuclease family protein [Candidatus Sericytochromatia bacterium]|nr:thermonuclease family protein [Candidatus Sericytochromatia bacterium]
MKAFRLAAILTAVLAVSVPCISPKEVEARRGCCSHHGGVCGCKCCDGTLLSDKCAPYYPSCEAKPATPAVTQKPSKPSKPAAPNKAKGQTFSGRVVGVSDGDTITVLDIETNAQYKIRLNGVDSPESKQPFGEKAKQFTSILVFSKLVAIAVADKDRYGRLVGNVTIGQKNLSEELVKAGFAWHYTQYSKSQILAKMESEARAAKRGLWADPKPVPPWEFRKAKRVN